MIDTPILNQLLLEAFSGQTTWLEASTRYSLDEFIDTFRRTRELMIKTVSDLSDEQVAYHIPSDPTWSISEMVTHLIYSQGFYYNQLLDISTSQLPHVIEAARGFGEGSQMHVAAAVLRDNLDKATPLIFDAIEKTRHNHDPEKITINEFFGRCTYRTWILLMLGHEVDHVRQGIVIRRAARTALPGLKTQTQTQTQPQITQAAPSAEQGAEKPLEPQPEKKPEKPPDSTV